MYFMMIDCIFKCIFMMMIDCMTNILLSIIIILNSYLLGITYT